MATRCSFSVALCTFNGHPYLEAQLRSILAQSRVPDQIVVCDDGSSDGSFELAQEILAGSAVPHRVERNAQRLGVVRNFEQAIRLSEQEVVVLSDQDDVWYPNKLAVLEAVFSGDPAAAMAFSNANIIDADGTRRGDTQWDCVRFGTDIRNEARGKLDRLLVRYPVVCGATMAVRRESALRCLPIGEGWLHDEWLSLVCSLASPVRVVDAVLMDYRVHAGQQVGAQLGTRKREWDAVKALDEGYFRREALRFERLKTHLESRRPGPDEATLSTLDAKIHYLRERERARHDAKSPWIVSTRLLLDGSHGRFGLGVKSWLQDVAHRYAARRVRL